MTESNYQFDGSEEERRAKIVEDFATMNCDCCRRYSRDDIREALDVALAASNDVIDYMGEKAKVSRNSLLALFFMLKELEANMSFNVALAGATAFAKIDERTLN